MESEAGRGLSEGRHVGVEDVVDVEIGGSAVVGDVVKEVEEGEASNSMSALHCDEYGAAGALRPVDAVPHSSLDSCIVVKALRFHLRRLMGSNS